MRAEAEAAGGGGEAAPVQQGHPATQGGGEVRLTRGGRGARSGLREEAGGRGQACGRRQGGEVRLAGGGRGGAACLPDGVRFRITRRKVYGVRLGSR